MPAGYRAVIRNIVAFYGSAGTQGVTVYVQSPGGTFYVFSGNAGVPTFAHVDVHQVAMAGDLIIAVTDLGTANVGVAGFLLQE